MKLFTPVTLGSFELKNRVIMAPLTRRRAGADAVPSPSARLYYEQRAGAGLIVSEGTCISSEGIGDRRLPGLWTAEQIAAWREITQAVHVRGGKIIAQLWHTGRASHPLLQPDGAPAVAPSAIAIEGDRELDGEMIPSAVPRALETEEIQRVVADYARAAKNAITAGFDGIELHGANGYLIDEFLQDGTNQRTDQYGGSIENRIRFLREVLDATTEAIGADRVALRLSPSSMFQSMHDSDPYELWAQVLSAVSEYDLAFLHLVEPGISGSESHRSHAEGIDSAWVREHFSGRLVAAGRYDRQSAEAALESGSLDAVAFGRPFLPNPDLATRFEQDAPLRPLDRDTRYTAFDEGYIDEPSYKAEQYLASLLDSSLTPETLRAETGAGEWSNRIPFEQWEASWALKRFQVLQESKEAGGEPAHA